LLGDGIKQLDGSFLHPRTHTFDPQLPVALSGVQRRLTEWSGHPRPLSGGSGSAIADIGLAGFFVGNMANC
jgi:hypothetical protein